MYKYYIEFEHDEHYPYAHEVAALMFEAHGITAPDDTSKPAKTLVTAALNWFHGDEPKMFYNTRNGLKRVYPNWKEVYGWLFMHCNQNQGTVKIDGKNYRYQRLRLD